MSLIIKIQNFLGVTKSELTVVSVILLGLIIGLINRQFDAEEKQNSIVLQNVYKSLDSLAEVQKTTYIGTDIQNNTNQELAEQDTIVKKRVFFAKPKMKSGKVNINTASKLELMNIPGIGEKNALKIIEYRNNKAFNKPEDIMNIKGIGEKKFDKMKDFIITK